MNNTGPTHPSPPDASPALNKMQERTEPPHQRAGRQQGTESEREKDTHLQLYCLVQSVRLALTATSIISSPSLSLCSLFEYFSLTHTHTHSNTLIQLSSFTGTGQAASHFTLLCLWLRGEPCKVQPSHRTQAPTTQSGGTEGPECSRTI